MVTCQHCGEINQASDVFCRKCGGRLLSSHLIAKEEQKRLKQSKKRIFSSSQKGPLKFLIGILGMCGVGYLIIQPIPQPRELSIDDRYATKLEAKLLRLQESYNNRQPYRVAFSEEELNSFVKKNLLATPAESVSLYLDDGLVFYISHKIAGRPISLKIYASLVIENNQFKVDVLQVRLGKLPIPSFVTSFLINKYFLKKFGKDFSAPPYITNIEFSEHLMYLHYDPYKKIEETNIYPQHEDVDALLVQANNAYKQKNYSGALRLYEKIISEYPDDPRVVDLKQWVKEIKKNIEEQ